MSDCEKPCGYPQMDCELGVYVTECEDRIEDLEAKLAKAVEALEALIQLAHDCEKKLTEDLHHMDFCGESEPLTKARAALAEIKGESHE